MRWGQTEQSGISGIFSVTSGYLWEVLYVRLVRSAAALVAVALAATIPTHAVASPGAAEVPAVSTTTPPTNAGKIFKWGNKQWGDEFVTPLQSMWSVNRPGTVRNQHGMLTLDATSGSVMATH